MKYILLLLLCCSCAGIHSSSAFFGDSGNQHSGRANKNNRNAAMDAGNAAMNSGNAAMDAGNAGMMHQMHHTPPPMPMAAPGF
jgi:hypothetical protein